MVGHVSTAVDTPLPNVRPLVDELATALRALPEVSVLAIEDTASLPNPDPKADASLMLEVLGRPARLLIEASTYGYPRDLRDAASRLRYLANLAGDPPLTPLIVADALSPGGKEMLRDRGIGYWDRGGSLYLKLPWALFYVDRPQPRSSSRKLRSLYRGSAAQVVHALLVEPSRLWHVNELAERAEVSVSRVHEVLSELEQHLWVEKRGRGPTAVRALVDPGALLDSWAEAHSLKEYVLRLYHGWSQSPTSLRSSVIAALGLRQIPYALTLTSGAEHIAPFVIGNERLTLLAQDHPALSQATDWAGLSPVDEGENVVLLVTHQRAPLLFRQSVGSLQVASTVQLYLDLWVSPRRGKEQARHLRAERLPY